VVLRVRQGGSTVSRNKTKRLGDQIKEENPKHCKILQCWMGKEGFVGKKTKQGGGDSSKKNDRTKTGKNIKDPEKE